MGKTWGALALAGVLPLAASAGGATGGIDVELGERMLVLGFPQAMQVLQNTRRRDLVRLTPAIAATCDWSSDTELACTLGEVARQATRYRVDLAGGLRTAAGETLAPATLAVETTRPRVSVQLLRWEGATPVHVVSSHDRVTADAIASVLRLRLDDRPSAVELRPLPAQYEWQRDHARFTLVLPKVGGETIVALSVVPGLRSTEGPLTGRQAEALALAVAGEPFRLRAAVCAGLEAPRLAGVRDGRLVLDGCAPGERMRFMFSREPAEAARKAWIGGWPAGVRLLASGREETWRTRGDLRKGEPARAPGWWVEFTVDAAHGQVDFDIPALPALDDDARSEPVAARVATVSPRPALRAQFSHALLADPAKARVEVVNASARPVDIVAFAERQTKATLATPAAGDAPQDILPALVHEALERGALVRVDPDRSRGGTVAQLAAPDFDVFASAGPREVLVWAMSWDGSAPVAGAEVELLASLPGRAPQVVARSSTAGDGTALLVLPVEFRVGTDAAARPEWLVRVQSGSRRGAARAVLPLDVPTYSDVLRDGVPHRRVWGVADRPLYRAGDTVHWRAWMRELRDGALVAPKDATTLALALEGIDGKLLHWSAPLDAMGAASGETRIPIHAPDGEYCLVLDEGYGRDVACFHVGTYRAQDLWMRASAEERVLRDGDMLGVEVEAGYYSGGSAAGVEISRVQAQLLEADPGEVHPAYADHVFVRTAGATPSAIADSDALRLQADGQGRARVVLPVVFETAGDAPLPAFGMVRVSAEAKLSDRESTTSNVVALPYARFDRYVGLRIDPAWFDATVPIRMHGVVIDAQGREDAGAAIEVEVQYQAPDAAPVPLRHCTLVAGQEGDCSFARKDSGTYRIVARSGDAAPATIERYVWAGHDWQRGEKRAPVLEVAGTPMARGLPVRLLLGQPSVSAQALLVTRWGGTVLDRRVVRVDAASQAIELPTSARWPHRVRVTAYVRGQPETDADALPAGYRSPARVSEASAEVDFSLSPPAEPPVRITFDATRAEPADTVHLRLHNSTGTARSVTLAVVDDALRALGARHAQAMDPLEWLGASPPYAYPRNAGFGTWNAAPWRWLLPVGRDVERCAPGSQACDGQAAALRERRANPIDVSSVESTTILTAEQMSAVAASGDSTSVALLAPGHVESASTLDTVTVVGTGAIADDDVTAPAPPPPPAAPAVVFDEPSPVDVPGSRSVDAPATKSGDGRPGRPRPASTDAPGPDALAQARVRTRFADTALWRTDIFLAPGETRVLDLAVPDNLTRWRAIAWSNDAGDDFAMTDAVLEAGLPVEARLQAPVRVYPGDRTRIATNVRHAAAQPSQATAMLRVQGEAGTSTHTASLALPASGQASFGVELAPERAGALLLTAAAATRAGRDAIATRMDVASPTIPASRTQAGWIGEEPLALTLPTLPAGASQPRLDVSIWRGNDALIHAWTDALRGYPHRCWEQVLSRAVAAALAIERGDAAWPGAEAVVQEALDNAAVFQSDDGAMRYFADPSAFQDDIDYAPNIALTAYTVDAFGVLRRLGHAVPEAVEADARKLLASSDWFEDDDQADELAFAASVEARPAVHLDGLWQSRRALSLPGRIAAARALAAAGHPRAADAFGVLVGEAPLRGEARVVRGDEKPWARWMGSRRREQCALIRLFGDFPQLAPAGARLALQAGLSDLYAGGAADVDTQTSAICLIALHEKDGVGSMPVLVDANVGATKERIALQAGAPQARAGFPAPAHGTLSLSAVAPADAPVAYLARVSYLEDARHAQSTAVGFALERRYAVLRGHRWVPLAGATLREGDWVRVTLVLSNAAARDFVAVTDDLPGGLRPVDLSLAGVAGVDVQALADKGDWAFDQRRLDPRKPRFYAEHLSPGRHEIHYFARVANTGDYLAAPAMAELMYGEATRARTAAMRISIQGPGATP